MKKLIFISILMTLTVTGFKSFAQEEAQTKIKIHTPMGDMMAVLYNETPKHRDNFIKLVRSGWYEKSPWHRVINHFMIQGGQNADGRLDPGYTVPAEFVPGLFHKKGVLAAARMPDQVNPEKASSGSQFYIVQGKVYTPEELDMIARRYNVNLTNEQIEAYTTVGGTPHLDGTYTVFGEVIEGLDVIDKIASVKTGEYDRPVENVWMEISIIEPNE
ncbi:MAG: peptidylprolyl isomerase [Bacteroidales bacterium]